MILFSRRILLLLLAGTAITAHAQQADRFAQIGNKEAATRLHLLQIPQPPKVTPRSLAGPHQTAAAFLPMNKLDTRAEMDSALGALREQYRPFLQDLAPVLPSLRQSTTLRNFDWRVETDADKKDFAALLRGEGKWEKVTVPHYGPPLGKAVTYYRTQLEVPRYNATKEAVYLQFKGVDYKASVFVNGYLCATNEGSFMPFEANITSYLKNGSNTLLVKVENDYPMLGHVGDDGRKFDGDKLYAATGMGYDDPKLGWHHNPPGMGINQQVLLQVRPLVHISDVFVRPLGQSDSAEVWVEIQNATTDYRHIRIRHSVHGQNFNSTVYQQQVYEPHTVHVPGVGDLAKSTDWEEKRLPMGLGLNFLKWRIHIPKARRWSGDSPWLYQLQLELLDDASNLVDTEKKQFGMRSFTQDTISKPKGMMYLNGKPVRLRGANNMGNLMLAVMRENWNQLTDDILLAKLTNMNYLRMTQMPAQREVYEYCDRLGMMTQTDLPLFGVLRRHKVTEAVRQVYELEKLVRSHPSNIMVSYINERFPNAEGNPQRHLDTYEDYERFFKAADAAVLSANPDRVIKAGDGDYDPPSPGLPDNHVYNFWYNGHGLGIGQMIKGYWVPVKPGWYYACGEFGAEGLDPLNTMKKYYPAEWLPKSDTAYWTPEKIAQSQTFRFHYMWFNRQQNIADWIRVSQQHQEQATRLMTEAFRRNNQLVSFAIHLFIDAWPAGWMKTIMDVDRQPKPAWFAYRDALTPLALNWRTDRLQYFGGERLASELWLCNDRNDFPKGAKLRYQVELDGKPVWASAMQPVSVVNGSTYQGTVDWRLPNVQVKTLVTIRAAIFDKEGNYLHETDQTYTVAPAADPIRESVFVPAENQKASGLLKELGHAPRTSVHDAATILISNPTSYQQRKAYYDSLVASGKKLVLLNLPSGKHMVGESELQVVPPTMGAYYFVSNATEHPLARSMEAGDCKFWYDASSKMIQPLLKTMLFAKDWNPVLITGNTGWTAQNAYAYAIAERPFGKGGFVVCQVMLDGRVAHNPAAQKIAGYLLGNKSEKTHAKR